MDSWGTPGGILAAHPADQFPSLSGDLGTSRSAVPNLPRPKQAEAFAVPCDDGLWPDDDQDIPPVAPDLGQPCPELSIRGGQLRALDGALQNAELMTESQDLNLKRGTATEGRQ